MIVPQPDAEQVRRVEDWLSGPNAKLPSPVVVYRGKVLNGESKA